MVKPAFTLALLALTLAAPAQWRNALTPKGKPAPAITLARNGQSGYRILLPKHPTTQEQRAAEDLQKWLYAMTGAKPAI